MKKCFVSSARVVGTALLFAGTVLSCKQGPDYRRPSLEVPPQYKCAATQPVQSPRLGTNWWELYCDPQLTALEEEATRNNQDVRAAMARVLQSRAASLAVKSQFYPSLNLDGSLQRSHPPSSGGRPLPAKSPRPIVSALQSSLSTLGGQVGQSVAAFQTGQPLPSAASFGTPFTGLNTGSVQTGINSTTNNTQVTFDLNYEVDIWGRVARSFEASQAEAQASVDDYAVVLQTVQADLASNYFSLRSLDAQIQILRHNLELYEKQVALTQSQFKAGLVGQTYVLQAQTLYHSTRTLELDYRRQRADLEHAIAILLGRPPSELALGDNPLNLEPPHIPPGLPSELLRRRPDVAEAEASLMAASAQIGVAKANFYPVLKLTGAAGFASVDVQHALDWHSALWSYGPSLTIPVFQGGLLEANYQQAQAKYQELLAIYRSTVLGAFRDVEDSLNDLELRALAAESQDLAVATAREYLRLTLLQYEKAGLVTYLIVIDAERSLLTNELAAEQIRNQRMISSVLLIKALGGGWDSHLAATTQPETWVPQYWPFGIEPKGLPTTQPHLYP